MIEAEVADGPRVDDFLAAVEVAMRNAGQIVPWPLHVARIAPFYSDLEAVDLLGRMRGLVAEGARPEVLARLYPSTSSAKSLMLDLIPGMKDAGVPVAERLDLIGTVFRGLAAVEHGDIFCRDGGHLLLAPAQAQRAASSDGWTVTGTDTGDVFAAAALACSGAAQAVVWSQHFYGWTDIAFVIHGPYPVELDDGRAGHLVVRDFFDLVATELWPRLPPVSCRTLRVETLHDDSDQFRIDIFNHLLHARPLRSSTIAVRVAVDERVEPDPAAVGALRDELVAFVRRQRADLQELDERELATKFVESRYYAFRAVRAATGSDWRPPEAVYRRLREVPLPPDPPPEAEEWTVLRDVFDPRLDWPVATPA